MESRMSLLLRIICNICRGLIVFQVLFLVQVNSFLLKHPYHSYYFFHSSLTRKQSYKEITEIASGASTSRQDIKPGTVSVIHALSTASHCSAALQTVQCERRTDGHSSARD